MHKRGSKHQNDAVLETHYLHELKNRIFKKFAIALTFASLLLKWDLTNINFMTWRIIKLFAWFFAHFGELSLSNDVIECWDLRLWREISLLNLQLTIWQMKHLSTMHRRKDQILHQKARRLIEEKIISQKKRKRRTFDKTPTLVLQRAFIPTFSNTYYVKRERLEKKLAFFSKAL